MKLQPSLPLRFVTLLALLLLAACQSVVRTDIATFYDDSVKLNSGTVRILPKQNESANSLEFSYYKKKLEPYLKSMGLEPTDAKDAALVAKLDYRVSRQEKDQPNSRIVVGTGFGYPYRYGHSSLLFSDRVGAEFEFVRELGLTIEQNQAEEPAQYLSITAVSLGKCEHLTVVYDEMLAAIFSNLYRPNGSVENVRVKGEADCP